MKIKSKKQLQVAENLKRYLTEIFHEQDILRIKNIHLTLSQIDLSPDLKNAKIYIACYGNDKIADKIITELNDNTAYFKNIIAKSRIVKNIPNLKFYLDNIHKNSLKINSIISQEDNKNK